MKPKVIDFNLLSTITVVCTTVMVIFGYENYLIGYNANDLHFWQLFSAHFTHYDIQHLLSNMLALGLLLYIFPSSIGNIIKGFVIAMVLIDAYLLYSNVRFYLGFSGLLYVVPGMACMKFLQEKRFIKASTITIIFLLYVLFFSTEKHISHNINWHSLKQAHLLGFIGGVLSQIASYMNEEKPHKP